MKEKVYIYGCGYEGKIVYEILQNSNDYEVAAFIDDEPASESLMGIKVLPAGNIQQDTLIILAIGNDARNKIENKKQIISRLKNTSINAIDSTCFISSYCKLGQNIICHPKSVIMNHTEVKDHVIIGTSAIVEHDNLIQDFVQICSNVTTNGNVKIGEGAFIGAGAIILPNIKVGAFAIVGAGAVVTKDVPDYVKVAGVPARIMA
jgi:sugar O-acyltransferase (sialic acid O-acetyltransferase NeuD family)